MRERFIIFASVILMSFALTVWMATARRGGGPAEADRELYLRALEDAPPIGVDLHPADPRAAAARAALARAGLGDPPLRLLFEPAGQPIVGLVLPGRNALDAFHALSAVRAETHLTPIILGDAYAVARHADAARFTTETPEAILRRARSIDVGALVASAEGELPHGAHVAVAPRSERYEVLLDPVMHFPIVEVALALVPTDDPSELPAWLAFGNWRGCPEPAVHVAMLAHLAERVAAQPVSIAGERIELRVPSPPAAPEERVALAELLARWAPGLLERDHATVEAWADTVVPSRSWSLSFSRAH